MMGPKTSKDLLIGAGILRRLYRRGQTQPSSCLHSSQRHACLASHRHSHRHAGSAWLALLAIHPDRVVCGEPHHSGHGGDFTWNPPREIRSKPVIATYLVTVSRTVATLSKKRGNILRFGLYAGLLSTMVAATFGVLSLQSGGIRGLESILDHLAHVVAGRRRGRTCLRAALLLWTADPKPKWTERQMIEAAVLLGMLLLTAGNRLRPALSRADEKRSVDIFVHAVLRFGSISFRPA